MMESSSNWKEGENYDLFLPVISHTDYLSCLHHYNYHITKERDIWETHFLSHTEMNFVVLTDLTVKGWWEWEGISYFLSPVWSRYSGICDSWLLRELWLTDWLTEWKNVMDRRTSTGPTLMEGRERATTLWWSNNTTTGFRLTKTRSGGKEKEKRRITGLLRKEKDLPKGLSACQDA